MRACVRKCVCVTADSCVRHSSEPEACMHEYHMFGTFDHVIACVKLVFIAVILVINVSLVVKYVVVVCVFVKIIVAVLYASMPRGLLRPPIVCDN